MKVGILCVFVLSVQIGFGRDSCYLTCTDAIDMTSQLEACTEYKYQATAAEGTFDEVRGECFELGGDLVQSNIGPNGAKYHSEMVQLSRAWGTSGLWIGYTDRSREGKWRFLDGELYDASNHSHAAVAYWYPSYEPNNGDGDGQNCGKLYEYIDGIMGLDDDQCDGVFYGLCEIKMNKCFS